MSLSLGEKKKSHTWKSLLNPKSELRESCTKKYVKYSLFAGYAKNT